MLRYPHGTLSLVLDCSDLGRAANFWCTLLGYRRSVEDPVGDYLSLLPANSEGLELLLQRVPELKRQKNRLHLDLRTPDISAEVGRAISIGARQLTDEPLEEDGWRWHLLADPDGNEFCILQPPGPFHH